MQVVRELRRKKIREIIPKFYNVHRLFIYFLLVSLFLLLKVDAGFILAGMSIMISAWLVGFISYLPLDRYAIFLNPHSKRTIQNLETIDSKIRRIINGISDTLICGGLLFVFATTQTNLKTVYSFSSFYLLITTSLFVMFLATYCIFRYDFCRKISNQTHTLLSNCNFKIVVHVSGASGTQYQIEQWRKIFTELQKKFSLLLIVRQKHFFDYCAALEFPAVFIPTTLKGISQCAEIALKESSLIVIYLNNSIYNAQLLIFKKLIHIHINHGDSDKGPNALNTSRDYDYLFVAGQASVDRHVKAHWSPDKLKPIGRPQTNDLLNPLSGIIAKRKNIEKESKKIVLYAPTFEGAKTTECYSSFRRMGKKIITDIVKNGQYRLIVKLHPYTGVFSSEYRKLKDEMRKFVDEYSDKGHLWVPQSSPDLYRYLVLADIVIGDVSSVCIDYLSLNKPLIAANPFLIDSASDKVLDTIPFWRGSYVLDYDLEEVFDIVALLNLISKNDFKKPEREKIARYYLGEFAFSPQRLVENFINLIEDVIKNGKEQDLSDEYIPQANLKWALGDSEALNNQNESIEF